ncbi:hypothetical protein Pan216_45330 [Planctomycetes bacterium Pan216]|uniref:DUF2344 domain-containing protein n=1 Tax=Kolteria novifilia TaxID=2527975 RepID=A0A518B9J2_9BACT|nr:hypothetical protein Pan216_45330 [Planctomycetes bacterium Pan216]
MKWTEPLAQAPLPHANAIREKVRIRFRKVGPLRFIGHQDLLQCWERLLRRTQLPLRYSEGFHPKPRVSSPLSLGLGIEGRDEIIEVELAPMPPLESVDEALRRQAVPGLEIVSVTRHPSKERARVTAVEYSLQLPPGTPSAPLRELATEALAASTLETHRRRPGKPDRTIDLRPWLLDLAVDDHQVRFRTAVTEKGTARPEEILSLLGLDHATEQGAVLVRSRVELAEAPRHGAAPGHG